ncbi:MAG: amidohydrolase [Phycisphaerales bacterium]
MPPFPLREAHAHLAALGESLHIPSLASCDSVSSCLHAAANERERLLRGARRAGAPAPFVRFTAARVAAWREERWPTLAELDAAVPDCPCVLMSFDHHAAAANSAAMRLCGLAAGAAIGANGRVDVDSCGAATGLLIEDAAYAAWLAAPAPDDPERLRQLAAALDHLAAMGYVEVHDLHSQPFLGPMLAELERAGRLRLAVSLYPPFAALDDALASRARWESPRLRLGGFKLFADGTLNSRTAHMLHRYAQPLLNLPRGQCMIAPAALEAAFRRASDVGLPLAVHAIGDAAVRTVLDALQRARAGPGVSDPGLTPAGRHRLEHCELVDTRDVPRFAQLGVVASVQPCHLLADVEALTRFLPHRLDRVLPLRELIDAGCAPGPEGLLWFGSDVPIVPADPRDSIQAAVHRRRAGDAGAEPIAPAQAIREREAWAAFAAPASAFASTPASAAPAVPPH